MIKRNNSGHIKFYEAISYLKAASNAEQIANFQLAITSYSLAIASSRIALQGKLTDTEKKSAQELITRASIRIQELQSFSMNNSNSIIRNNYKYQNSQNIYYQNNKNLSYHPNNFPQQAESNLSMNSAILRERPTVKFSDVSGLFSAKQTLTEAVLLPIKIPSLFRGPTQPWKGILLYGPPGTGKSFLAKAVAGEANDFTFLTVSTAELTSKYVGESEKLIKSLFETARQNRPAVIFIDEIDSLVSSRDGGNESECGRRIKTEFLIQMDGVSSNNDGVLVIAATNLPWSLDSAIRRRFEKRVYVPLPDYEGRLSLFQNKLKEAVHSLSKSEISEMARITEGFSGADISILVRDALMQPIREFQTASFFVQRRGIDMEGVARDGLWSACSQMTVGARKCSWEELPVQDIMRPVAEARHFRKSVSKVRPSVSKSDLNQYEKWTKMYGEDGI